MWGPCRLEGLGSFSSVSWSIPLHQRKLNLCQINSASSGSRASIFPIVEVKCEGPEEVASLSCLN